MAYSQWVIGGTAILTPAVLHLRPLNQILQPTNTLFMDPSLSSSATDFLILNTNTVALITVRDISGDHFRVQCSASISGL